MTGCLPGQACPGRQVRFDITAQVPAEAPVELAATFAAAAGSGPVPGANCASAFLEVEDASLQRSSRQGNTLAALLIRQPTGTVTLVLFTCGIDSIATGTGPAPVSAEVRTVVRPDVLPPYMPVTVRLAPGDRILAMGEGASDLESMVVVPPGLDPVHVVDQSFNVTEGMPTGDYVVVVKGGEAMLHGPNVTLVPVPVQYIVGEPRHLPSGGVLSWSTPVPGVPVYGGLVMQMGTSATASSDPTVRYYSDLRLAVLQGGTELALYEQPTCTAPGLPCQVNGFGGFSSLSMGTGLFPEDLRLGDLDFEAESSMSQGVTVHEVIGYVSPVD